MVGAIPFYCTDLPQTFDEKLKYPEKKDTMSNSRPAQTSIFPRKGVLKCHVCDTHYLADICMTASVVHGAGE